MIPRLGGFVEVVVAGTDTSVSVCLSYAVPKYASRLGTLYAVVSVVTLMLILAAAVATAVKAHIAKINVVHPEVAPASLSCDRSSRAVEMVDSETLLYEEGVEENTAQKSDVPTVRTRRVRSAIH